MYCMICQKPLHRCTCADLDERLDTLKGSVGDGTIQLIRTERALTNAGRDMPPAPAPKTPVKVEFKKGSSPIATLELNKETKSWLKDQRDSLKSLEEKVPYLAPEHPQRAYYETKKLLIESLEKGAPIEVWEINRALARKDSLFSQEGFNQACNEMLG